MSGTCTTVLNEVTRTSRHSMCLRYKNGQKKTRFGVFLSLFCRPVCTEVGALGVGGQGRGFLKSRFPKARDRHPTDEDPSAGTPDRGHPATFEVEFLVSHSNHKGVV